MRRAVPARNPLDLEAAYNDEADAEASIHTWECRENMVREEVPAPVETVFIVVPPRRATLHV